MTALHDLTFFANRSRTHKRDFIVEYLLHSVIEPIRNFIFNNSLDLLGPTDLLIFRWVATSLSKFFLRLATFSEKNLKQF